MTPLEILKEMRRVLDEVKPEEFDMGCWWVEYPNEPPCGCLLGHAHAKSRIIRELRMLVNTYSNEYRTSLSPDRGRIHDLMNSFDTFLDPRNYEDVSLEGVKAALDEFLAGRN